MDNTIIRDLFAKDINRSINGVVKVQDSKDGSIRQELDEYVVTRELQGHLATFFKAYGDAIDVPPTRSACGSVASSVPVNRTSSRC